MTVKTAGPRETLLARRALSKEVADELCARIRRDRLAPDTLLGTEAELARQFGVSRTVIREAVGQLRGLGLVKSRQGLGLSVASADVIDTVSRTLAPALGDESSWPELCHVRFILEVGSLPLAVERATADQIEHMRQLAEEMRAMVKPGQPISRAVEEIIAQREIEFHQLVFDAAGCQFAGQFYSILVEYFHQSTGGRPHSSLPTVKDMQDHVKLAEAIAEREMCKAHSILVDHIRNILYP